MCRLTSPSASPTRTPTKREERPEQSQDRFVQQEGAEAAADGNNTNVSDAVELGESDTPTATKMSYGRELLLLFRVETKDPEVQLPIRTIRVPSKASFCASEHDDEKLVSDLETRLSREDGFDERNAETFPDSHSSDGWSYEEAIEANEALLSKTRNTHVLATAPSDAHGANSMAVRRDPFGFKLCTSSLKLAASASQTTAESSMSADAPVFKPASTLLKADAPEFTPGPPGLSKNAMRADAPTFDPERRVQDTTDCAKSAIASRNSSKPRVEVLSTTPTTQTFVRGASSSMRWQNPYMHRGLVLSSA